ncbi:hypothetical protein BCR34DRAFT_654889 [Clohesyomyces aquaticus]|uniref:DUF676 domain-containing protein n=1 Tax=Clohesyomyces aquaticus TaxID=1231657 RepID=A0A1Y1ZJG2_9PLEO|nr:hypothetical protein BCR34DRAFT_654889 [Clohesyomyces aquaticus]
MLLTPRTFALAQVPDQGTKEPRPSYFLLTPSRKELLAEEERARRMLLLHQTGSVKVGEVVRYTLTYTPSEDRILPSPPFLHVKIKNTSAIPLRAAYLHGPYTIHVAAYPSSFNPNKKVEAPKRDGVPEFEPNLKAGGSFTAKLTVPEDIREGNAQREANTPLGETPKSATWIIEIASQIIFSQYASVNYELLVARDERSLDLGFTAITGNSHGAPGQVRDHQQGKRSHTSQHPAQPRGVYSKAVKLVVDDTTSLWNKPELPEPAHDHVPKRKSHESDRHKPPVEPKQKNIHLVILTHGLHSNLGADMLYLKESIDATAKQAREGRRRRRQEESQSQATGDNLGNTSTAPLSGGQDRISAEDAEDDDDEEVVVRGFSDNVIRTERGIQYLGKRLAKYVLGLTYPDQPFRPIKKTVGQKLSSTFSPTKDKPDEGIPAHAGSSIHLHPQEEPRRAYRYTSISFIAHSLGGLVQTYAIAYIYKHSPEFFDKIEPINFITLASPFLGLSNENPMYVKFALDFGLVGRTGQDLGLTWRAPTLARSGWTAMVSGLGAQSQKEHNQENPGAKPLLRILPTGPAHVVLRKFRNRTVYSNVVNDGIVPLRTSCLLFLDWRGLGKVDKARRENGLIGTVAAWGFGQLTGQNTSPNPSRVGFNEENENENDPIESPSFNGDDSAVPQPGADVLDQDNEAQATAGPSADQFIDGRKRDSDGNLVSAEGNSQQSTNTLSTLWNYIRPSGKHTSKDKKMFKRSQTVQNEQEESSGVSTPEASSSQSSEHARKRPPATRGDSLLNDHTNLAAPPKTTIFESAGDLLSPPVPPRSWIIDPSTRARTIFHDRVYHPEDIPPPPAKRPVRYVRSFSSENSKNSIASSQSEEQGGEEGGMRVEEKIARAYHKDLSWRKVLVRLEPDAHNNIIVRRMFANAYGWPVIKHLCDTHFGDTWAASTRDENEPATDRAKGIEQPVQEDGEHVKGQTDTHPPLDRSDSEMREVADELLPLDTRGHRRVFTADSIMSKSSIKSRDSTVWDDVYFEGSSDDEAYDQDDRNPIQKFLQLPPAKANKNKPTSPSSPKTPGGVGTSEAEIDAFLSYSPAPMDVHRGLGSSPGQTTITREPDSLESMGGAVGKGKQPSSPPTTSSASCPLTISRSPRSPIALSPCLAVTVTPSYHGHARRAQPPSTRSANLTSRSSSTFPRPLLDHRDRLDHLDHHDHLDDLETRRRFVFALRWISNRVLIIKSSLLSRYAAMASNEPHPGDAWYPPAPKKGSMTMPNLAADSTSASASPGGSGPGMKKKKSRIFSFLGKKKEDARPATPPPVILTSPIPKNSPSFPKAGNVLGLEFGLNDEDEDHQVGKRSGPSYQTKLETTEQAYHRAIIDVSSKEKKSYLDRLGFKSFEKLPTTNENTTETLPPGKSLKKKASKIYQYASRALSSPNLTAGMSGSQAKEKNIDIKPQHQPRHARPRSQGAHIRRASSGRVKVRLPRRKLSRSPTEPIFSKEEEEDADKDEFGIRRSLELDPTEYPAVEEAAWGISYPGWWPRPVEMPGRKKKQVAPKKGAFVNFSRPIQREPKSVRFDV